ncbi:MAG TPA: BON domain-containing protein [Actinomycetota bacterium]|nr:BON domain-containing protein [Actinomycetota bacterium]
MRIRTLVFTGAAAAALAYLFEPTGGRARRERLRASLGSLARRQKHTIDGSIPLPRNLAPRSAQPEPRPSTRSFTPNPAAITPAHPATTEASTEAAPDVPPKEPSTDTSREQTRHDGEDDDIVTRVTSTLRERRDLHAEDLVVDVVNGIAYLSGDLHDPHTFGEIVDVTGKVPGVRRVQSLLHLPDSERTSRTMSAHRVGEDTDRQR